MDSKDYQITMGAAVNNAVRLVAAGIVELDSDDVGEEIAELAQLLFDAVIPHMEDAGDRGGPSSRKSSGGSRRSGSGSKPSRRKSGGRSNDDSEFKKLKGDITEAQERKLKGLLKERSHDYDISFRDVGDLSKQEASDMIGDLLEAEFADF